MRLRNKVLAAALATAMIVPVGGANVFADTNDTTKSTDVKYKVSQEYTWSIHSEIDFGQNAGTNKTVVRPSESGTANTVSVTKNVIPEGKKLNITVKGSGANDAFTIKNGNNGKEVLTYDVKNGGENKLDVNGTVLDVNSGTNTGSASMNFTLHTTTKAAEVAGDYSGTVTYTASVIDQ